MGFLGDAWGGWLIWNIFRNLGPSQFFKLFARIVVAFAEESVATDDADEKAAADADKEAALLGLLFCSLLVGVVGSLLAHQFIVPS